MATLRQDLGPVTAYAFAVEKGYTGTEEEYAELMASYATVAEAAAGSASDAADSASDAEAYGAGTRGGSAVESGDEAYHNNAKYYAESAADDASTVASAVNSFVNITVPAAVQSVTDEGTTQKGLVQGEGTTQIGLVSSEGTAQVGAVEAKGAEVLESIPEDYTELSDDVSDLKSALCARTNNLFNKDNAEEFVGFDMTGTVQVVAGTKSVIIPVNVTTETKVTAHRTIIASRFAMAAYTTKPVSGSTSVYYDYNNASSTLTISVDSSIKYLMIYVWRTDDSPITFDQVIDGLMVQFGDSYTGYEPYYVPNIADGQVTENKLSNDVNEQMKTGEIQDIIFDDNLNLWGTSLLQVMNDTRCSGYNTTTYVITTATDDKYATAIMDIPKNIDKLKVKRPATIPSGGQMYVAISSALHIASNRPFSALSASFMDQLAEYTLGNNFYILDLAEMRNRGYEKLAISTYSESSMYVQADKIESTWLVCDPDIYCPIGAFSSIGAIGDSYTAGSIVKADNTWVDMPNQSYIAVMGKRAGISWSNYGLGGTNTRTYITNKLPAVLSADANDFYFLALGINDSSLGLSYIGSISDIHDDDYTQNADTFYGNYGKIIARVKAHAPNARFCMIKTPIYLTNWVEIDAAIQSIADHYGFACIDPKDDPYFHSKTFYARVSNHPSCIGYAGMALAYERLLSKAIEKNPLYFFYSNIDANIPSVVS